MRNAGGKIAAVIAVGMVLFFAVGLVMAGVL